MSSTKPLFQISLILFLVSFTAIVQYSDAINFAFDSQINISNDVQTSQEPQVITSGSNVYVVWRDGTSSSNISFSRSVNNGQSFGTPITLNSSSAISQNPELATSGTNVYAIWEELTSPSKIGFARSDNSGMSFQSAVVLSSSSTQTSTSPKIDASNSDVYAVWVQDSDIFFTNSTDNGQTFGTPLNLNASSSSSTSPSLATSSGNIFVTWRESNDISFIRSTDNGDTFDTPVTVSSSNGVSQNPEIGVESNNVYIIWHNSTDILFARSDNNGLTFGTPIDIGDTGGASSPEPKLAIDGANVFAIWRESISSQNEISFAKSSNSGASFSTSQNISGDSGSSINPQIAASLGNVTIAWRDDTDGDTEIFFRASEDSGTTFGSTKNLSNNTSVSIDPSIALGQNRVHVVWDESSAGNREIFYASGMPSPVSIILNQTGTPQFTLNDVVEVSITDTASNLQSGSVESITANVKSDADSTGIDISLTETSVNSGIFNGTFTFDRTSSSEIDRELFAEAGDTITASYGGESSTATIFPITIEFQKSGITFTEFDHGDIVNLKVTNQNENLDENVFDTIDVTVTSLLDPSGDTLTLNETGVNTGIFGGSDTGLIFMGGNYLVRAGQTLTINQENPNANTDSLVRESTSVFLNSTSDAAGITLELNEKGNNSDFFSGTVILSPTATVSGKSILVSDSDFLTVASGLVKANALVIPNTNSQRGAVQVTFPGINTVTATHSTASASITVKNVAGPGGGGGGLTRPGLVVNALAGVGGGGGADYSAPTLSLNDLVLHSQIDVPPEIEQMILNHDSQKPVAPMEKDQFPDFDYPLMIGDSGFVIGGYESTLATQTLTAGQPTTIQFALYEATKIQHFSLYTNLRDGNDSIAKSDTQILYNDGKDLKIVDPHGLFDTVSVKIVKEEDSQKKFVVFDITFANPMDTSDIIVRTWDPQLHSMDTIVRDAIRVEPAQQEQSPLPQPTEEVQVEELRPQNIPIWVKNNAGWWSADQISDDDFVAGIQYLIQNGIIAIPSVDAKETSVGEIPYWIKNNAGWWADYDISDDEFVNSMKWLVANGVIRVG